MKNKRVRKIIGVILVVIAIVLLGVFLYLMKSDHQVPLIAFLAGSLPMIAGLSLLIVENEEEVERQREPEAAPMMAAADPQTPLGVHVDQTIIMPKSKPCPQCHNMIDDGIAVCPFCGEKLHGKVKKQVSHGVKTSISAIKLSGEERISGILYVEKRRKQEVIRFVSEQGDELSVHDLSETKIRIAVQDGASRFHMQDEFYYLKNDNISHFVEYLANNYPDQTDVSFN